MELTFERFVVRPKTLSVLGIVSTKERSERQYGAANNKKLAK